MPTHDIARLRQKLGLSQTELADAFGLAGPNVVSRWEIGQRVPNEGVRRVCRYLAELPKGEALAIIARLKSYGKRAAR